MRATEPGGEHQFVVRQPLRGGAVLGGEGGDGGQAFGVPDGADLAHDHPAVGQDPAQRHDDVARGDGTGGRLGEERLVGHVGVGRDDRDLGLAPAQFPPQSALQAQGRVHPDVAATDNENARTFLHRPMTHPALPFVHSPGDVCDRAGSAPMVGRNGPVCGSRAGQRV
ncbi:hypothetical protein GCM10020295_44880 [Streptomyces cinereospinus]